MNLMTVIVLLILLVFVLNGYRRGFIRILVSMVSVVLSIVLVYLATPYVTQFLKSETSLYTVIQEKCQETFGTEAIVKKMVEKELEKTDKSGDAKTSSQTDGTDRISEMLKQMTGGTEGEDSKSELLEQLTKQIEGLNLEDMSMLEQTEIIENLQLPTVLQDMLEKNNNKTGYEKLEVKSFDQFIPNFMANLILNMISFVLTLLLVGCFLWISLRALDVVARLPILRGLNQKLGLVLGLVQGLVFIWIGFLILTVFSNTDIGGQLMGFVHESPILSFLYNKNIFLTLLSGLMEQFM